MKKLMILAIVLFMTVHYVAIGAQLGDKVGPYTVTNIVSMPASAGAEDIVYANNSFYTISYSGGKISRIDLSGQLVDTWQIPELHVSPYEIMHGLAYDGTYFYTTGRNIGASHRKLTLGTAPNITVNIKKVWPTNSWAMDLAYANGYLYYPDYRAFPTGDGYYYGGIVKVDPGTLNIVDSFKAPSPYMYGMAFDGESLLSIAFSGQTYTLYSMSPLNGAVLKSWTVPFFSEAMDFDISNETLYLVDNGKIITATIPEPCTLLLLGLGGVMLRKKK